MKTLYIAYTEVTVYGVSWISTEDSKENAMNWWRSEGEEPAESNEIEILELNVPDSATDENFIGCIDVRDYEETARKLLNEQ